MAQSQRTSEELSAEDRAQLDQMRAADADQGSEPAVTETPAEQPQGDQQPSEQPQQQQRMVPHGALHEERERRKETERLLNEERQRIRTLEERTNLLLQRINQAAPQAESRASVEPTPPPIPDMEKDPVGHIMGTQRQLAEQLLASQQATQQQQAAAQQELQQLQAISAVIQRATAVERQYQREHPDYAQAVEHLELARHQELERVGFRDPEQRQLIIKREALQVAAMAFQDGGNPAERLYELAKMRGYAPPQSSANTGDAGATQQQEHAGQAAQERLQNIAAGQQQSRSIGNMRGSSPQQMDGRRMATMPEKDFAAWLDSATPEKMHEIFGS